MFTCISCDYRPHASSQLCLRRQTRAFDFSPSLWVLSSFDVLSLFVRVFCRRILYPCVKTAKYLFHYVVYFPKCDASAPSLSRGFGCSLACTYGFGSSSCGYTAGGLGPPRGTEGFFHRLFQSLKLRSGRFSRPPWVARMLIPSPV